jgi:hypothetical protein
VCIFRNGRFGARLPFANGLTVGSWLTAREAAIARDRAVLYFRLDRPLNFPTVSRRLGAASVQELRREARLSIKRGSDSSTRYMGVRWDVRRKGWQAHVWNGKYACVFGLFATEKEAAMARDQVVLHYCGDDAILNFPRASVTPMSLAQARQQASAKGKELRRAKWRPSMSVSASGYAGVVHLDDRFRGQVRLATGKILTVGYWLTAREAAIARDRAVLHFQLDSPLNLPNASRRRGPASVLELRREARLAAKRRTGSSSRYMGVYWIKGSQAWEARAKIDRYTSFRIGLFPTQKEAAMAHDRVALHCHGAEAMLNFSRKSVAPMAPERMRQLARAKHAATKRPARSLRTRDARAA